MTQSEITPIPFNGRMKNLKDRRFGRLVAKEYVGITKNRVAVWKCQCDCGNEDLFLSSSLLSGRTVSCGCYWKEQISVDHTGKRFGKLITLKKLDKVSPKGNHYYLCQCDCGNQCEVESNDLTCGNVASCGCLRSRKEFEISNLFKEKGIDFKQQYYFKDLKDQRVLPFDFAIFKNNELSCLLEYHGQQHYDINDYMYKKDTEKHDNMKIEYCKNHNIPLIIINKDNYNKLFELIKEFI